jgi:hypothetical protein
VAEIESPSNHQSPENNRNREELLRALNEVRSAIAALDFSGERHKAMWQALCNLETFYDQRTGGTPGSRTGSERDLAAVRYAASLGIPEPLGVTISAFLDAARKKNESLISGESTEQICKKLSDLGVLVSQYSGVFVQTDLPPAIIASGAGTWSDRRTEPRLQQFLAHLQTLGIHGDDVIVRVGSVSPTMMRSLPYVIVEIPGLSREVVICNEVGEITFVSDRRMGPQFYSLKTKDELRATPGISTVTYRRMEQWVEEISVLLFTDRELIKIDVRSQEAIRNAIIAVAKLTPEEWVKMSQKEKGSFRVPGSEMGMCALATRFGIKGNPISFTPIHLELGERIFGSGTVISERLVAIQKQLIEKSKLLDLRSVSQDEVRQIIKDGGMTPERWVEMTVKDKKSFRVPGSDMGMRALATRFGVKGSQVNNTAIHLQLGERIFGVGTVISERLTVTSKRLLDKSKFLDLRNASQDEITQIIKDAGMTPEQWVEMSFNEKKSFRVPGSDMGMRALARRCGIKGDPVGYTAIHLELGERIFGSCTVISERLLAILKLLDLRIASEDEIRQIVNDAGITPEQWVSMTAKERRSFRIPGSDMGMNALARVFGVEGDSVGYTAIHLELGERIFGSCTVISERLLAISDLLDLRNASQDEITQIIKEGGITPERWVEMSYRTKKSFRVPGSDVGMKALARRFDIRGNPVNNTAIHLELGERIFGVGTVISERVLAVSKRLIHKSKLLDLRKASRDEITQIINDAGITPEQWVRMSQKEKQSFRVPGSDMGMRALARRCGIKGDPVGYTAIHLELGEHIFGRGTIISERLLAISKLLNLDKAPPDVIAQIIKDEGITPEYWVRMTQKAKRSFRVPGSDMGMNALATRFGIKGSPIDRTHIHLELGERIFGAGSLPEGKS